MGNQEDKKDNGKLPLTQVPSEIIYNVAAVRQFGMKKYSKEPTWRNVEVERYRDALYRHWLAYVEDPYGLDEESGLPHLYHVAWNCATLCELEKDKLKSKKSSVDLSEIKSLDLSGATDEQISKLKDVLNIKTTEVVAAIHQDTVDTDGFDWKQGDYVKPTPLDYETNFGGMIVK